MGEERSDETEPKAELSRRASVLGGCLALVLLPATAFADPPNPDAEGCVVEGELPAGSYFTHATYSSLCPECATPYSALVEWVADEGAATDALNRYESAGLAPGYPFVLHADELGEANAPQELAVVLQLFDGNGEAAACWLEESGYADAVVISLEYGDDVFRRLFTESEGDEVIFQRAVQIETGGPAVSAEALNGISFNDLATVDPANLPALCEVERNDVFVVESFRMFSHGYGWVPVWCPDGLAYVRRTSTRVDTIVSDGGTRQVVDVQCDSAYVESWSTDADRTQDGNPISGGGCGGP